MRGDGECFHRRAPQDTPRTTGSFLSELLADASRPLAAFCAAFNLLTFMSAWCDVLGWLKLLARPAA